MASTADKIAEYVRKWRRQGYSEDVPDEVPVELMHDNLAPSYKAIAMALLRNDHGLESLGFTPPTSLWYSAIKRVELADRARLKGQKKSSGEPDKDSSELEENSHKQGPYLFDLLCREDGLD